jgi:hypothetical protein
VRANPTKSPPPEKLLSFVADKPLRFEPDSLSAFTFTMGCLVLLTHFFFVP